MDDPKWLAFYGMLQVNARIVERVGARMERETGLPPAWFEVLAKLHGCALRMGELAEQLTLSRGGATRLIARMEEAGLVEREIPKEDRRATFARITAEGHRGAAAREAGALRGGPGALERVSGRRAGRRAGGDVRVGAPGQRHQRPGAHRRLSERAGLNGGHRGG